MTDSQPDTLPMDAVKTYLLGLQDRICEELAEEDGREDFIVDSWERPGGGGGRSRVLAGGAVFEKAGVNFSHVLGEGLPPSATAARPELATRADVVVTKMGEGFRLFDATGGTRTQVRKDVRTREAMRE